ncbi:hypothetical protein NQU49_25915, partial [Escherichia coli]|uniref:hypothetical protein n=1 Tax=Escherichia coli TaxID=562 RepID=UPI00211913CF
GFKHVAVDLILVAASLYVSLWLRLGSRNLEDHVSTLNALAVGFVAIRIFVFLGFGVYQSLWRYVSTFDATKLGEAVLFSTPLMMSLTYLV